jgi:uroporphyrinogen decarboxylase
MTKKERVLTLIKGHDPDRCPVSFSCHFPAESTSGEEAVRAHLAYIVESGMDIAKVMNENQLRGSYQVSSPEDFTKIALTPESRKGLDAQVDLVARVAEALRGELLVLVTIHGPFVSIQHMSCRPGLFVENLDFYRKCKNEAPAAMKTALEIASEWLCELTRRCLSAGADGIYLAAHGNQKIVMSDEEYTALVRPFDLRVLESAGASSVNVLHMCGKNLSFHRFRDYPAQIVNWEFGGDNLSMEEGFQFFGDRIVMGGLSNAVGSVVENGAPLDIARDVHRVLATAAGRRFILGAGCTLPASVKTSSIRQTVLACESYAARHL